MNVLSLFDGISCGRVALERAGIDVEHYYASEIDQNAIHIAKKNYPDTIPLGDIQYWESWIDRLPKIDLVIGGSPCQGFSSNGKGLNFKDPRSKLFFTMVDIYNYLKKHNNPDVHILLENVFMKKEWEDVISGILGFQPVKINSERVTGALRARNYWADWEISQPEDKGIVLQDLLEHGLAYKRKADCIQASYDWGSIAHSIEKSVNTLVAEPSEPDLTIQSHNASHRSFEVRDGLMTTYQMLKENSAGVRLSVKAIHPINLPNGWYTFRGFTPRELERLQTLPDFYCDGLAYKDIAHAVGNGWTVDIIAGIFRDLMKQKY